jgi:hypothetical protein
MLENVSDEFSFSGPRLEPETSLILSMSAKDSTLMFSLYA